MENREYSFETRLLHNRHKIDSNTGAVSVAIQHASTFHQFDIDHLGNMITVAALIRQGMR
jgi:cystathionine beta-lyase